jgi:predicted TPR repeat methyltransferase
MAWTQRGSILKDLGRLDEAAASLRRALAEGGDAELNRYLLASIDGAAAAGGEAPRAAPRAYVEGLFDQYAASFDEHLVARLGYRTPELLAALLPAGRRFDAALDLGCGTGLMAPLLQPRTGAIDGVDLSRQMLDKARALAIYRELRHADVAEFLRLTDRRYDLVVAADVFVYVGALDAVFDGIARVLAPDGLFLFSVEEAGDGRDLELRTTSRYAHGLAGLRRLATLHGLAEARVERATLRHDQGQAVTGLCVLLRREAASPHPG